MIISLTITSTHTNCLIQLVKERLVKPFVSTEARILQHLLNLSSSFSKFSFLLNRLRFRSAIQLLVSGRRILQDHRSLSTPSTATFENHLQKSGATQLSPHPQHPPEHNLLFWKAFFAETLKVGRIIGPQIRPSTPKTE